MREFRFGGEYFNSGVILCEEECKMMENKKKSNGEILPREEELKFRPAVGFEKTTNNVMAMVGGREISERPNNPGEPDCDMLRRIVD